MGNLVTLAQQHRRAQRSGRQRLTRDLNRLFFAGLMGLSLTILWILL